MMTTYTRCTKCILSSAFPGINYDEHGVCNFCRDEIYFTTEDKAITQARKKLSSLLESQRNVSEYDAIMCYSGGKDSTYTLMMAVQKYKLRLLAFTLDNGFISPTAFKNIHNVITATGVDHLTFRPLSTFLNALIKTSALEPIYNKKTLTRISSICNSCISIVNMTALKIALEKEIPFIIAGFTLGQIPANSIVYKNNYRFFEESRQPVLNRLRESVGPDVDNYLCISDRILDSSDSYPHNLNLLCLEDISEKDMINAIRKVGWSPPDDVDGCSSNCSLNGFNNFVHQKTFDYSPYELELSHLIRKGKLTRSEALQKITDQLKPEGIKAIMTELKIDSSDIEKLSEIY